MAHRLLLVRHAAIAPQYANRYVGSTDAPPALGAEGQVRALADLVRDRKPGRCFSSPLLRARRTAEWISETTGLGVEPNEDLREVDFGRWEGRTFAEIAAGYPDEVGLWARFAEDFAFPGGESLAGFMKRIRRAADLMAADPAETVLAVTHGGVIRMMICHLLGLSPQSYVMFDVRCGTVATLDVFDGRGVLSGLNETGSAGEA